MRVDFSQTVNNFKCMPLKIDGIAVTLEYAAVTALLNAHPGEDIPGVEKAHRYDLARRIATGEQDFHPDELALIKLLIGKTFTPIIVGPTFQMLDNVPMPADIPAPEETPALPKTSDPAEELG